MQQLHGSEPRASQTDRAIERVKALRKLNYSHSQALYTAAREFGLEFGQIQRELTRRSVEHRKAVSRKAAAPPPRVIARPEFAPASSVPAGDR